MRAAAAVLCFALLTPLADAQADDGADDEDVAFFQNAFSADNQALTFFVLTLVAIAVATAIIVWSLRRRDPR